MQLIDTFFIWAIQYHDWIYSRVLGIIACPKTYDAPCMWMQIIDVIRNAVFWLDAFRDQNRWEFFTSPYKVIFIVGPRFAWSQ